MGGAGDLALSRFEDKLSDAWPRAYENDLSAVRATSAFYRVALNAAERIGAEFALFDVGPNLGAINRAALIAADYLVVPLAADLFSLQGLRNLGPQIAKWRGNWMRILEDVDTNSVPLPSAHISPLGYVVLQHAVRLDRPTKAYQKWVDRIPSVYRQHVLQRLPLDGDIPDPDPLCLAALKNYRSLMAMAQGRTQADLRSQSRRRRSGISRLPRS